MTRVELLKNWKVMAMLGAAAAAVVYARQLVTRQTLESAVAFVAWRLLPGGAVIFAIMVGTVVMNQRKILYVPLVTPTASRKTSENHPLALRSPGHAHWAAAFFDLRLFAQTRPGAGSVAKTAPGGVTRLHAWLLPSQQLEESWADASRGPGPYDAPVVMLFLHGNAGNIGHRLPNYVQIVRTANVSVLALEYRGFGDSQDGEITEDNLGEDSVAAWRWLCSKRVEEENEELADRLGEVMDGRDGKGRERRQIPRFPRGTQFIVFGRSLGGACASALVPAAVAEGLPLPAGVILENTFTSIPNIAGSVFPFLKPLLKIGLFRGLVHDQWDSGRRWRTLLQQYPDAVPHVLFMSGAMDELVPASEMRHLFAIVGGLTDYPALKQSVFTNHPNKLDADQVTTFGCDASVSQGHVLHVYPTGTHNELPTRGGDAYWQAMVNWLVFVAGGQVFDGGAEVGGAESQ